MGESWAQIEASRGQEATSRQETVMAAIIFCCATLQALYLDESQWNRASSTMAWLAHMGAFDRRGAVPFTDGHT